MFAWYFGLLYHQKCHPIVLRRGEDMGPVRGYEEWLFRLEGGRTAGEGWEREWHLRQEEW